MYSDIKFESNKDKENNKNNKCSELINFPKEEEKQISLQNLFLLNDWLNTKRKKMNKK